MSPINSSVSVCPPTRPFHSVILFVPLNFKQNHYAKWYYCYYHYYYPKMEQTNETMLATETEENKKSSPVSIFLSGLAVAVCERKLSVLPTFGAVHATHRVQHPHGGLARLCAGTLEG